MASAREQAREAAKARFYDSARTVNPDPATAHVCNVAADAASDVWEPLVREALEFIHGTYTGLAWERQEALLAKLREALDG